MIAEKKKLETEGLSTHFEAHGYVSIPGFLSPDEVAELNENVRRYIRDVVPNMPAKQVFYEDPKNPATLKQIQEMFTHAPYFHNMMFGSRFEQLAEVLLDEPVIGKNMQHFNKPPNVGQATPPHQDGYYFMLKPNHAITMWLALEDVDEETGCVRYVDRSHKWGMRAHGRTETLGFSQGIIDFGIENDVKNEIAFPCKAGHLIAHHSLTIHRADANRSQDRTRRAMGFIYYGQSAGEDAAAHRAYQDRLANEMAANSKL